MHLSIGRMRKIKVSLVWLCVAGPILAPGSEIRAEDDHLGLVEYEIACMPCHGVDARGKGPSADTLNQKPPDLTQIAKSNGGQFPVNAVAEVIDGRKLVAAHGSRVMPVWGNRYRVYAEPGESKALVERRARRRIEALVRYIQTLQDSR